MREDLRRDCAAIWVIDCSPEGHQADVSTRIFQGVQQPVCIVLAARSPGKNREKPAKLKYVALPRGHREEVKFPSLAKLSLNSFEWRDGPSGWREPFLPEQDGEWASFVSLSDFFEWDSPGVLAGRTWVIAPDPKSLQERWLRLVQEKDSKKKEELFFPTLRHGQLADRHTNKLVLEGLAGHEYRPIPVASDTGPVIPQSDTVIDHLIDNGSFRTIGCCCQLDPDCGQAIPSVRSI